MICLKNKKAKSSAVVSIEKEKKIREEELVGKWSECWLPPPPNSTPSPWRLLKVPGMTHEIR